MDDLISRQAVYDALDNIKIPRNASWYPYYQQALTVVSKLPSAQIEQSIAIWQKDFREYINMLNIPKDDYNGIMEYIDEVPSAQSEHKTGHWIPVTNGRGGHQCDRCGCYAPSYQSGAEWLSNFCPECNADMKGEAE